MCRWMAYVGDPISVGQLLYAPRNSLVHQSLESRLGAEPTNGDGFGLGCYVPTYEVPVLYRTVEPAWNDQNLAELTRYLTASCFVAHVRAAIGSPVQRSNCHPFRRGRWLFMHNGFVDAWPQVHRELMLEVDPAHYHDVEGTTDSEALFQLALSNGLTEEPVEALERMVALVEEASRAVGSREGVQMTVAVTNGTRLWAARYATRGQARSLYRSAEVSAIREMYPDEERLHALPDVARVIVSEPLTDLPGMFEEVPSDCVVVADRDGVETLPFGPRAHAGIR